jgi:hypothetical protein
MLPVSDREETAMASDPMFTCPYHGTTEKVPGVPYLLECGCKCTSVFDKESDAERSAEAEDGQVVMHEMGGRTKYLVVIYIPTAVVMPR